MSLRKPGCQSAWSSSRGLRGRLGGAVGCPWTWRSSAAADCRRGAPDYVEPPQRPIGSHRCSGTWFVRQPSFADRLTAGGCEEILVDKASAKLARRPALDQALLVARPGDQLLVSKLDRLGGSLEHLIVLSKICRPRGVDLVVLDQGSDTSTAVGRMFFQILGAIAEFEHALMSERTRDGLEAARTRGRTGGQRPKMTARQPTIAQAVYDETGADGRRIHTVQQIAEEFGVARPTIHRHLQPRTG
jgi:DNA invertase Pin-like site-specific DNA recombinase